MHPRIRRDLALLRKLNYVNGGAYRPFLHDPHFNAASSFENRGAARTPDSVERDARAGVATMTFDLKPAIRYMMSPQAIRRLVEIGLEARK